MFNNIRGYIFIVAKLTERQNGPATRGLQLQGIRLIFSEKDNVVGISTA